MNKKSQLTSWTSGENIEKKNEKKRGPDNIYNDIFIKVHTQTITMLNDIIKPTYK